MSLTETYHLQDLAAVVAEEVDLVDPSLRFALVVWDTDKQTAVYATSNEPDPADVVGRLATAISGIANAVKASAPAGNA
jgi:5,10-methenyltetrahydromethanopterin hydrogenase